MQTAKKAFIFFLAILAIKDLSLGLNLLLNLEWLMEKAEIQFHVDEVDITTLATFFGVCVLIVSTLCMLAISWTVKGRYEGIFLGKFIGWWMIIASVIAYSRIHRIDYSIIDFLSGIFILLPTFLMKKEPEKMGSKVVFS